MEEEVDELGDLEVIDSDLGFICGGNDQVLLFSISLSRTSQAETP